jgi:16S rRNA G966 N2-methylase RsmD
LILSRFARESILIENGFAQSQIAEAVMQNVKVKSQCRNLKMEPYEEALELGARNLRRALIFNNEARK